MSGLGFDVILAAAMIVLAIWEAVIAIHTKSVKRIPLIVGAIAMAVVLLWLRGPEWWPW